MIACHWEEYFLSGTTREEELTPGPPSAAMSELSDEASEPELLNRSLSMWHGLGAQVSREELDVPLDLHTAASIGQYEVVKECVQR